MIMLSRLLIVALLLSGPLLAQINLSRQTVYTITNVAGLPATGRSGQPYLVQDSADGTCLVGGGAIKVECVWDGAWSVYGGGAGGAVASVNGLTGAVTLGAADVGSAPTGSTASANVQAAIAELTTEKLATNGDGSGLDGVVTEAGTHTVSGFKAVTGTYDFGNGILEIPNGTTLPATCAVGNAFMDTDAPTGQRHYLCQASNVWVLQGGGSGSAALSGTANFLAYFDSSNSAISNSIGVTENTLIFPVSVGRVVFGAGGTYIHETTANNLRIAVGGTDRVGFSTGTISGLALGRFSLRYASNSCAQPTFSFTQDDDNGLCYEGANNFGLSVGGTKRIDFTAALQTFSTPVQFDSYLDFPEVAAPANPAADFGRFFVKDDAGDTKGCFVGSAGVESCIGEGGGSGDGIGSDVASDVPFVPYDTLAATNVQAAIQELLDEGGGGGAADIGDLNDVDPTGAVPGDALVTVDGVNWTPGVVLTPTNVSPVEGKTIIGGLPRTGTNTLPAGSNELVNCSHQDNVPSLVGVHWGTLCVQENTGAIYQARPNEGVAGVTDASGDWFATTAGAATIAGSKSFLLPSPATGDTGKLQFEVPSAVTLTEISCNVDAATSVTINLVERARATPDSGTTQMLTADLVCDPDGAVTTAFTDAALAGDVPLALMIDAVSGAPTWLRVHVQYTVN